MDEYVRIQADINVDAVRENLKTMQQCVGENMKLLAVIKANAYGHGAVPLAREIDDLADYYGVAILSEALELRRNGIKKPILILGYTHESEFQTLIEQDITPTIFTWESAKTLSKIAVKLNRTAKIHIKIDTGMSRIGFPCKEETVAIIKDISQLPNLLIEGIFTHYAKADEKDKQAANIQLNRFRYINELIKKERIDIPIRHIGNSAGIMEMDNEGFTMVRSGISTYGLYPSEEVDAQKVVLHPAMSLKTKVVYVKTVEPGVGIGYGWTYTTTKETKVATIPVGYADGYPRALSNQGRVLIHGEYANIIGRVCMDQFMVDVTHIDHVAVGDEVILVGKDGEKTISVEELANPSASFNYEFVCDVGRRVPRYYYRDGNCIGKVDYLEESKGFCM